MTVAAKAFYPDPMFFKNVDEPKCEMLPFEVLQLQLLAFWRIEVEEKRQMGGNEG